MNYLKRLILIAGILISTVTGNAQSGNWLSALPDNVAVRELSIPGAHDAATGNGFADSSLFGAIFSGVTQSLSLSAQWDAGVRAFDLRPTYKAGVDGSLQLYHGILETKVSLKSALQTLVDKLVSAPGEMAVVLLRHESDSDNNSELWSPAVSELLAEFDRYIATFAPDMTLGDARGKIIVLSRDSFSSDKAGMITGWSHSENFDDQKRGVISLGRNKAVLYVQDFYGCQTVDRKYKAVKTLLDYSTTHTSNTIWIINHVSGYTGSTGTNSNVLNLAKVINSQVADYLDGAASGRTGIVMIDFAGAASSGSTAVNGNKLVDKIVAQNIKYIDMNVSGITSPVSDGDTIGDDCVYDLHGRYLGRGADKLNSLPAGTYIYGRSKIIIR